VFQDPEALSLYDAAHSGPGEDRWIILGMDMAGSLLIVCHTWRETGENIARCRIISARKATSSEARQYHPR